MAFLNGFLLAFSALLPMINPLGSALVFMGLVGSAPPKKPTNSQPSLPRAPAISRRPS